MITAKRKTAISLGVLLITLMLLLVGFTAVNTAFADNECQHEYEESVVESTCSEMGYTLYTCKFCGDNYKDNYTDFLEHDFTEIVVEPTCTERGYTTHLCRDCGYNYSDNVILPFGHTFNTEEHAATCTEDGYTLHVCETCGETYTDHEVKATGHDFKAKVVEATCTAYGFTVHTCENCGDKYIDNYVYPTGHNFEDTVIEPTEDTVGYTFHRCVDCSYTYLSDFVRSGETPYFPEEHGGTGEPTNPTGETEQGETPVIPDEPTGDEQSDHEHLYILYSENYEDKKYVYIRYFCVICDKENNDLVQISFTSESGNRYNFIADENGKADYSELPFGVYEVEMFGESGQTLTWYQLTLSEEPVTDTETPTEPQEETPTEPEQTSDGETEADFGTGENEVAENKDKPDTTGGKKGNSGLMTGIIITLLLLAAGAVVTLILIKKKNKKNKENDKQ